MLAVWQTVAEAQVEVAGKTVSRIGRGALVLLGVEKGDTRKDASYIAGKCARLRVFSDSRGLMNLSLADTGGELLLVSQFTLCADCRKGRRPSFVRAARPEEAEDLYEKVAEMIADMGIPVKKGVFRADMQVGLVNDGPVTLLLDSKNRIR
ncbi:MAG TPA: D-tyrosyl-tRNA(Tyr) deacylase [Thermodesulfobacteriaceae bacterium]|nr:D-tyrosyl-tRNA(Tyr) deacylase [Thermodesulfobacteriaceae bacterium]